MLSKPKPKKETPKLGQPNVGQIMPKGMPSESKKITSGVLSEMYKTIQKGNTTFRYGGENYTVSDLASDLRPLMTPSDHRKFLAGQKVKKLRPPTSGSGRMDVVFADEGMLVISKKRKAISKSKTGSKKSKKGSSKYGCGLFK